LNNTLFCSANLRDSEIDVSLSRKFADKFGLLFKATSFDSDSPAYGDTTKLWVQLTAGF